MYILGIETSCDDTCIGIIYNDQIKANIRYTHLSTNSKFGGIVPELCAREHIDQINIVLQEALDRANITIQDINYIGVTVTPGLIGSLLVGGNYAYTLAKTLNIPLIPIHHLEGHILVNLPTFPCDTFILSGGHTMLIRMEGFRNYKIICNTLDDAIGEYFDKVGRSMGLPFPAGKYIEEKANPQITISPLPIPLKGKSHFSFSGLKTETIKLINKYPLEDICAFMQITVGNILEDKINNFVQYPIVAGGGVVANKYIRSIFDKYNTRFGITYPPIDLCVDNGVMIARAAYYYIINNYNIPIFDIRPSCSIEEWCQLL